MEQGALRRRGDGKAIRQLALLAIPTFGQLIAEPAFVLIDTAIVGHVGTTALAGLSLGSTIVLTAVGLCIFLAYATTSQVSRLFGAGKRREGLAAAVDEALTWPGVYYVRTWLNEGRCEVGDSLMYVLIGADIRPNCIDALQKLVGHIKNELVVEKEIFA